MKILCYRSTPDFYFEAIISCLSHIKSDKFDIGYMSNEINSKTISDFSPDVVIHNIENINKFPVADKSISININETSGENSFSFKQVGNNFLKPFVILKDIKIQENELAKFSSDVLYIGSPSIFSKALIFLTDPSNGINFKFFTNNIHNVNGYCGMCDTLDYFKFYNNAKASLAITNDVQRIMDIVVSNGNPVLFDIADNDGYIEKIKDAIYKNKKYEVDGYNKEDIINNDTAFDRMSYIFKTVGLNKFSDEIIKTKRQLWSRI